MKELSTERAIEALYTIRAYYASLTAGYPKGKDRRGIGDVMCSEIANSCLMAIKALEQEPFKNAYIQAAKERDIAIGQLNELGYSLGEKIRPCDKESENKECRGCHYNDGEPHAECVVCDKAAGEDSKEKVIAEIDRQEKWLAEAGYNAYNVGVAFCAIKHALGKRGAE